MTHIWATCPACETEILSDDPKPQGYKLPTTDCIECLIPLCEGSCKDTAHKCESCGALICNFCMAFKDKEFPMCSTCAERFGL